MRSRKCCGSKIVLPTERSKPVRDPWKYAYLITGEKKVGKTTFAIEGEDTEELVLQFDKPQLATEIREQVIKTWNESVKYIKALEERAEAGTFPYNRVVIDGVYEWYMMCQTATCKHFGIEHPSDEGFARGWHHLRDNFTDAVNRILRLQASAECGAIFIAHAEWKEVPTRGGGKIEKLVPDLTGGCERVVNGKVDGWFVYTYDGDERVMVIRGDELTGAGHRIDGSFLTPGGEQVREIPMGNSAAEGLDNFLKAFNNKQEFATIAEFRAERRKARTKAKAEQKKPAGGTRRRRTK